MSAVVEYYFTRDSSGHETPAHSLSSHSLILHVWQKHLELMCRYCDGNAEPDQLSVINEQISCMPDLKEELIVTYLIQKLSSATLRFLIMFSMNLLK